MDVAARAGIFGCGEMAEGAEGCEGCGHCACGRFDETEGMEGNRCKGMMNADVRI
jgi:hypothetical protein